MRTALTTAGRAVAAVTVALMAVALTGCSGSTPATERPTQGGPNTSGDPASDKLAQVLSRGTLVLSTDLAYPPQSMEVAGATRSPSTKCTDTQLTGDQVTGYDAETGKLVADRLGVEPCFVTPQWPEIVSGSWGDRWDISWGSGAINGDRMERLWMTQPYRAEPSRFFVLDDSPFQNAADLSGLRVGACAGCTHELYLRRNLVLPGIDFAYQVDNPIISTFDVEAPGLKAVADGTIDAFLCAEQEGQSAIKDGRPLRALEPPAFTSMLTGFVDKKSGLASAAFVARVNEIIAGLHSDGSLKRLSEETFGQDYASAAAAFDLGLIGQTVG
jgi:polar amino acid transport system substrate-binding protein